MKNKYDVGLITKPEPAGVTPRQTRVFKPAEDKVVITDRFQLFWELYMILLHGDVCVSTRCYTEAVPQGKLLATLSRWCLMGPPPGCFLP